MYKNFNPLFSKHLSFNTSKIFMNSGVVFVLLSPTVSLLTKLPLPLNQLIDLIHISIMAYDRQFYFSLCFQNFNGLPKSTIDRQQILA